MCDVTPCAASRGTAARAAEPTVSRKKARRVVVNYCTSIEGFPRQVVDGKIAGNELAAGVRRPLQSQSVTEFYQFDTCSARGYLRCKTQRLLTHEIVELPAQNDLLKSGMDGKLRKRTGSFGKCSRCDSRGDTAPPFNKLRTPARVRQRRSRTRSSTSSLRLRTNLGLEFLEQDDVRIGVAAEDAKTLAIWRPVKREDALGIEVGDLVAGSASDRLNPDVIHAILGDRVGYELPVCRELHAFGDSWVGVKNARRAESRNVQQRDFPMLLGPPRFISPIT